LLAKGPDMRNPDPPIQAFQLNYLLTVVLTGKNLQYFAACRACPVIPAPFESQASRRPADIEFPHLNASPRCEADPAEFIATERADKEAASIRYVQGSPPGTSQIATGSNFAKEAVRRV
jgi:hypothetical protein